MLLIIAAASHEFAGFSGLTRHRSSDVRWLASVAIGGSEAILVANGVGRSAAASGARRLLAGRRFEAVISTGFAGALDPSLEVGEVLVADRVQHGRRMYRAKVPSSCPPGVRRGAVLTVDKVVGSARAKQELARRGALAVDMEAAAVAELAAEHGLAFYCVRSISDPATADLPVDFNRALRRDGTFSPWNVARQAGCHAGIWGRLLRLTRDARKAAESLARCLSSCEFAS